MNIENKLLLKLEQFLDSILEKSEEVNELYWKYHDKIAEYNPHALLAILYGFMLLFFGRNFIITFSIIEAFRHTGSEALFRHIQKLQERLHERNLGNAPLNNNNFNFSDKYPKQVLIGKVSQSLVGVISVVKVKFLKYTALGISLGEDLNRVLKRFVLPILLKRIDQKYHDIIPDIIWYSCRIFGILVAVLGFRFVNIVVTSVRGAFTIALNVQLFCQTRGWNYFSFDSHSDFYLVCCLIPMGILFQTFGFHNLPSPIRAIFFPTYILELLVSHIRSAVMR